MVFFLEENCCVLGQRCLLGCAARGVGGHTAAQQLVGHFRIKLKGGSVSAGELSL